MIKKNTPKYFIVKSKKIICSKYDNDEKTKIPTPCV